MGLSITEIGAVLAEVHSALVGGWVQKVFQPTPHAIVLEVRAPGQTLSLLLSAHPGATRLHLVTQKIPNPPAPPPFCQFLRAHIQGARIDGMEQIAGDRIVRINLTTREGPRTLVAELTGRSADLLLLNQNEQVLASLDEDRERVGTRYQPPPARTGDFEETREAASFDDAQQPYPLSAWLEQTYQDREAALAQTQARQGHLGNVRKAIKKTARRIEALKNDLEKAVKYQDYARYGELLKANLGRIKKGHKQVAVVDYFDPAQPELVIPLDPSKTSQGNMDDYFKKHRKYLAAEQEIRPRIDEVERELATLRQEHQAIQEGTWKPPAIPSPSSLPRGERKKARGRSRSGPFRRFTSADGLPIYVGRNARENEELTIKFAHSDDLWLHAQGSPGSHVVVRLEKGANPPPETLKDAATLALLYSDLKKSGKGDVIYTKRKHVRKAKGRVLGTVTVTQEKSMYISLDKIRLAALKERSEKNSTG